MAYGSTACTISISRQRNDSNVIPQKMSHYTCGTTVLALNTVIYSHREYDIM